MERNGVKLRPFIGRIARQEYYPEHEPEGGDYILCLFYHREFIKMPELTWSRFNKPNPITQEEWEKLHHDSNQ